MRKLNGCCRFIQIRHSSFCPGSFDAAIVRDHYNSRTPTKKSVVHCPSSRFRMVLPPPNVTGNLHIGHAVTVAIEDAFIRYHKLLNHESVVEKQLFRETGKYRREISNAEFVKYCERWKDDHINEIKNQLTMLGADLDWPQTFYTMDKRFSSVVSTAFCRLHREGLIFRQKRLINWCPILQSTISDQEVEIVDGKKTCSRSGGEIVELEKEQWFLRCDELHDEVLAGLRKGEIKLKPETVEGKFVEWLNYSEPWCLSRQLLWGHSIPAFFNEQSQKWIVAPTKEEAKNECDGAMLSQDSDVLDTWFSSSLIPLVVGGWPERPVDGPLLEVMETGHDIIGFWVARMLTLCKRLTNYFPFENVVLHGMIRDGAGRKMSKSLGNVIDPLDVINGISLDGMLERLQKSNLTQSEIEMASTDLKQRFPDGIPKFGTDALRFAFLRQDVLGVDVHLNIMEGANEGYRFCNKLWNMVKYAQKIFDFCETSKAKPGEPAIEDFWLQSRLSSVLSRYHQHMSQFEPHLAFNVLYKFILNDFCDVYVETTKKALWSNDAERLAQIAGEMSKTVELSLKMLTTFMPFVATYLLDGLQLGKSDCLLPTSYAISDARLEDRMELALAIVSSIRMLRNELSVPKSIELRGALILDNEEAQTFSEAIKFCGRFGKVVSSLCNFTFSFSVLDSQYYLFNIEGQSASLGIAFQGDNSEKVREILAKQLSTARHRRALFEQALVQSTKLRAERSSLNSEKPSVLREIRKLDRTIEKAKKVIYGKTAEIEKLERLLGPTTTMANNSSGGAAERTSIGADS